MRRSSVFVYVSSLSAFVFGLSVFADEPQTDASAGGDPKVTVLFDGSDISHWQGREDLWSVEDGQIVGRTSDDDPIAANTFLIWQGDVPENFELTAQFKIEGGNSGIQYRSRVLDEKEFIVGGYQADIDFDNKFAGILYEEKGRGILAKRGERVTIDAEGDKLRKSFGDGVAMAASIHPGKWNDFRVLAVGNRLQHFINEMMTAEVIDDQPDKASADGVIGLQLHRGPAMTVRFKNIKVRQLD